MVRVRVLWCLFLGALVSCSEETEDGLKGIFPANYPKDKHTICIDNGCLKGKLEEGNDESYEAWYGIPFAAPPLGQLRFKSPRPPARWSGVRDATVPRYACTQIDVVTKQLFGSEDCLYLNVYRPAVRNSLKPLPVLVFIHGGSFKVMSADPALFGPDFLMDTQEVIVVTIQYRLNVFGFLAADHVSCKGNFGLKDQNMALRWINRNIGAFGGNPKEVTLMGQSAGAASVQYQMMSKRSNGLFKRGIMTSGSALAFWSLQKNPEKQFRQYAELAGIPKAQRDHRATIVKLLRQKTAAELMEAHEKMFNFHTVVSIFRPVVEGQWSNAFLKDDPEYIWESGRYQQRPFLTGVNGYEEGSFGDIYYNKTISDTILANFEQTIEVALEVPNSAVKPVTDYYFEGNPTEDNIHNSLRYRDRLLDYPMYKTVQYYSRYAHLEKRPVDLYLFNFTAPFSTSFLTNPYPIEERGASHTDELLYLFRFKIFDDDFERNTPENDMKNFFVRYIVDYVKFGRNPLNKARPCRRQDMVRGFCEYLDIQRDYSETPNAVQLSTSNQFEMGMVKVHKLVDQLIEIDDILNNRCY